jgi:hypothetical protein
MLDHGRRISGGLHAIGLWTAALAAPLHGQSPAASIEDRLVAPQNAERASHGLTPLRWNAELAKKAMPLVREMAATGTMIEGSAARDLGESTGENVWAGTTAAYSPEEMVQMWLDERQFYKPGAFPEISSTGQWHDVGHYSQIVWKRTKEIGCAIASGADLDFLVCLYAEGGNVVGERPY